MPKRILSLALAALLMNLGLAGPLVAAPRGQKQPGKVDKVKAAVAKLGSGPEARVVVRLRNDNRVKGHIREATDEAFVVVDPRTSVTVSVPYAQVRSLKGENARTGTKASVSSGIPTVGLFAGVAALAVAVILLARGLNSPN